MVVIDIDYTPNHFFKYLSYIFAWCINAHDDNITIAWPRKLKQVHVSVIFILKFELNYNFFL